LTDAAIRLATMRAHQVDFFARDQENYLLTYTVPSGNQLFVDVANIYGLTTRLRTPDFLQGEDLTTYIPNENLEHVPDYKDFWDNYNELRSSVFTLMGSTLRARFLSPTGRARLFYYVNPNVVSSTYSSWIADLHPDDLAMWAAAIVWIRSGFQEIAARAQQDFILPFKDMLVTSYMTRKI